jgi:hypothetical protein
MVDSAELDARQLDELPMRLPACLVVVVLLALV